MHVSLLSRMAAFAALLALNSAGQELERQPPPDARDERPHRPHGPPGREENRDVRGRPPVDRWLQRLETDHPEEFARLMDLKRRDPTAFPTEMRRLLRRDLGQKLQRDRPAIFQAVQGLPGEDREWLMDRLFGGEGRMTQGQGPGGGPGGGLGFGPRAGREDGEDDPELRRLAGSFRAAQNDEERQRVAATLRDHLRQSFTRRQEQRRQEMDQMMEKLRQAQVLLREREKNREAIIDRRMQELTAPPHPVP